MRGKLLVSLPGEIQMDTDRKPKITISQGRLYLREPHEDGVMMFGLYHVWIGFFLKQPQGGAICKLLILIAYARDRHMKQFILTLS